MEQHHAFRLAINVISSVERIAKRATYVSVTPRSRQIIRLSPFVITHIIPSVNRSECIPALRFSPRVFRPYTASYARRALFLPRFLCSAADHGIEEESPRWKVKISVNARVAHVSLEMVCILRNARSRSISVTEILAHLSTSVKGHMQTRNLNHLFRYILHSSQDLIIDDCVTLQVAVVQRMTLLEMRERVTCVLLIVSAIYVSESFTEWYQDSSFCILNCE